MILVEKISPRNRSVFSSNVSLCPSRFNLFLLGEARAAPKRWNNLPCYEKVKPKSIVKLTCLFCKKILPYLPKSSTKRGRLCTFPDHQIISILVIKDFSPLERLSFSLNHIPKVFLLFTISIKN